MSSDNCEG
jgi:hypothetical protein